MTILMVHNFHRSGAPSGDDAVFRNEIELLKSKGYEVIIYKRNNDELFSTHFIKKIPMWFQALWSLKSYINIKKIIQKEKPDVVHFHNIFPLISPSGYDACREMNIPVVQTLHDFRFLCPIAFFFRNGRICEECPEKGFWNCIRHRCFRNSRFQSAIASFIFWFHKKFNTWLRKIDLFICLTESQRKKFIEYGFPADKIIIKPNFFSQNLRLSPNFGNYAVFIGRLSPEKGIDILIKSLQFITPSTFNLSPNADNHSPFHLKVIGSGPQQKELQKLAEEMNLENIEFLGMKTHAETMQLLQNARFLIMPSIWNEGFPMIIAEAFANSKPVIGSRLGAMADLVKDGETGLLFEPGNSKDLAEKIKWLWEHPDECRRMGANARREYDEKYTPEQNYKMLMDIYQKAIEIHNKRKKENE